MAPQESPHSQNMSPAEKLLSLRENCQPCAQDRCDHKSHQGKPGHHQRISSLTHYKPSPLTKHHTTTTTDNKTKPQGDADSEDYEAKLWSVGCKSAVLTIFLYGYGNNMLFGQLPMDPRVDSWLFMQSPMPTLIASLSYIAFCTYLGPRLMKDREPPMGLKYVMILYNAFQVVFSAWMFYEGGMAGWFGSYSYICQPCDFSQSPQALRMLNVAVWYNVSKFIDFLDTIFFVLNKKYSHISLLHVTHHSLMPIGIWYGLRHEAGGQTTFFGFLNCFVHTVMYLYYLLAAMGPKVRPFLWWKKYLTKLQMVQFVVMFAHALLSMSIGCQAGAPLMRIILVMAAIFQLLFTDFYIKAYLKRNSSLAKKKINFPVFCSTLNTYDNKMTEDSGVSALMSTQTENLENQTLRKRLD